MALFKLSYFIYFYFIHSSCLQRIETSSRSIFVRYFSNVGWRHIFPPSLIIILIVIFNKIIGYLIMMVLNIVSRFQDLNITYLIFIVLWFLPESSDLGNCENIEDLFNLISQESFTTSNTILHTEALL